VKIFGWNFLANFYSSPEGIALSSTAQVNAAQSVHSHRRKKVFSSKEFVKQHAVTPSAAIAAKPARLRSATKPRSR
jgi:hypothetical protein